MRQLMDLYLDAKSSTKISDFENKSLVDLIVKLGDEVNGTSEDKKKKRQEAVAETIENNVRKVIIEESQTNPKYYEKMSKLLDEIIKLRKQETCDYQEYLDKIKKLAIKITEPSSGESYPNSINTRAKQALYDNLENNESLANILDETIRYNKLDGWRDGGIKEKKLMLAVNGIVADAEKTLALMDIIKAQREY
jgi:type I restriction enzyme R subunit